MSVFTSITQKELQHHLENYNLGTLVEFQGISEGIENTNFFVTTSEGEYVLTLFEQLQTEDVEYYLQLIQHFYQSSVLTPAPVKDLNGNLCRLVKNKPAALIKKAQGASPEAPYNSEQIESLARSIAQYHSAGESFPNTPIAQRDKAWREQTVNALQPHLSDDEQTWLHFQMQAIANIATNELPKGVVHADLFPDNTLYEGNQLSGIIDWYLASYDYLLYDLAITVNAWFTNELGELDQQQVALFLSTYNQIRPLTENEKACWKDMLRLAGLRFWLSRMYDKLFPREGELTFIKDPQQYKTIIDKIDEMQELPWIN